MTDDLRNLLVTDLKLPPGGLSPDAGLEDAGFDSLAFVELSVLLRDRYGLDLSEADLKSAGTLTGLDRLIDDARDRQGTRS